jgi:hypothetical protein
VLTRNINTGTPEGRLFFHITAAFDEFQRELIVENTRAGLFRGSQKAGTQRRAAASFGQGQDSRRRGNAQAVWDLLALAITKFYVKRLRLRLAPCRGEELSRQLQPWKVPCRADGNRMQRDRPFPWAAMEVHASHSLSLSVVVKRVPLLHPLSKG